jgi:HAMP domain-containing protein
MIRHGHNLRARLFLAHLLVIGVGVITLLVVAMLAAPNIHDRLMADALGSGRGMIGGAMMAGMDEALAEAFRASLLQALLLSASAAVLAAVAVSLVVSARIVTPVLRILAASARIAGGHYAERVPEAGGDELGALAAQFNTMAAELAPAGGADRRCGPRAAHAARHDRGLHRGPARRRG